MHSRKMGNGRICAAALALMVFALGGVGASVLAADSSARRVLPFDEAVRLARVQSVDAAVALNQLRAAYWRYRSYRAELLPEVLLGGTVPEFKREYELYQREDGSYRYVRTNMMSLTGNLSISQNIPFTSGKIGVTTSLQDVFPVEKGAQHHYLGVPIGVKLSQPLWSANRMMWERRIEPLRYKEAQAVYLSAVEKTTLEAVQRYFSLLLSQEELQSAQQNEATAKKLVEIAVVRRGNGDMSLNDFRHIQLNALNAEAARRNAEEAWVERMYNLKSFLGLPEQDTIVAELPTVAPYAEVDYPEALGYALQNNAVTPQRARRMQEARYGVAKAKGNLFGAELIASVGLTGQGAKVEDAYRNPIDYQQVRIGISIPIVDWGHRRGQVRMAQWSQKVVEAQLAQEEQLYRQELSLLVSRYNRQQHQLDLAFAADTLAKARYQSSIEIFVAGQIGMLELNDAQQAKDNARQRRIAELHLYWNYYYRLRAETLHDFSGQAPIDLEVEKLVR